MIVKRGKGDFPTVYRPYRISEVYGQTEAKKIIQKGFEEEVLPKALLFDGISGTGKTTFSRIIGMSLLCEQIENQEPCCKCDQCKSIMNSSNSDYEEINTARLSVKDITQLRQHFCTAPFMGHYQIHVFDECHSLSEKVQTLLLQEIEKKWPHNYFIFCTSISSGVIEVLRNRLMQIEFVKLSGDELFELVCDVCLCEGIKFNPEVLDEIVEGANGMARNALFLLQKARLLLP